MLLGDYVGYGADPEWTVTTVMELVDQGAMAVLGNHDNAIGDPREQMNLEARIAIEWTRGELSAAQRQFLAGLPYTQADGERLYVHSEASDPPAWIYVTGTVEAAHSLAFNPAIITFCGHVHQPAIYSMSATAKMTCVHPDHRRRRAFAARTPLARRARFGRAAARRQPGRRLRHAGYGQARTHLLPRRPMTSSRPQRRSAKKVCRDGWPTGCSLGQ